MKSIQECKDTIAKKHGYDDWYDTYSEPMGFEERELLITEAMELYAHEACKQQVKACVKTFVNLDIHNCTSIDRSIAQTPLAVELKP